MIIDPRQTICTVLKDFFLKLFHLFFIFKIEELEMTFKSIIKQ